MVPFGIVPFRDNKPPIGTIGFLKRSHLGINEVWKPLPWRAHLVG